MKVARMIYSMVNAGKMIIMEPIFPQLNNRDLADDDQMYMQWK